MRCLGLTPSSGRLKADRLEAGPTQVLGRTLAAVCGLVWVLTGCAPTRFEQGLSYYADAYHVRDAATRRAGSYGYLRSDELTISDLDDAIRAGREHRTEDMRRLGIDAIRAAGGLARSVAEAEIDRLPAEGRARLANLAKTSPDPAALKDAYGRRADDALATLVVELESAPAAKLRTGLEAIRREIEPAPDDRGRAGRQLLLAWGALPAWMGVSSVEKQLESASTGADFKPFERSVACVPGSFREDELLARYAPAIVLDWPDQRTYPTDTDQFGEVYLTGQPTSVQVHVNTARPVVYAYKSEAKIDGKRHPQLVYVWWFPERPEMTRGDAAAGRIDGDTLRITLDSRGRPAVFEVVQGCGCGHLVFVAEHVETMARRQWGRPEERKELVVERAVGDKRDLIVAGVIAVPERDAHPVVYVKAGYHSVTAVRCVPDVEPQVAGAIEKRTYAIDAYDHLNRLPLGDGVGSMFGPDGLVHNAGRREGYLLAPTGILSAGQPRQRGTQKIRWDDYSFDDPRLLERALRLPDGF
ncbi:MAG: hypothetical protein HY718_09055 [Planctomycetes bacterium]|nr:hypothetical protein [Planctomycetota bacterium]